MKIQKFYFDYTCVKNSSANCRIVETADSSNLQHYYMKFVIENRLFKILTRSTKKTNPNIQPAKNTEQIEIKLFGPGEEYIMVLFLKF